MNLLGELFAPDVKGMAASLNGTLNWLLGNIITYFRHLLFFFKQLFSFTAFVITKTFTNLVSALGRGGAFWLFSGLSVLGTVFIFFIVPETKGKSLNEIQTLLAGEKITPTNQTEQEKN